MGCIVTLGMTLTHIYPSVVSWAFWQDLPERLLVHISSYSVDTLQEQAKIWVLSDSESAGRQGVWALTEPRRALKDVKYSAIADIWQGILLEVALCFLQSPQRSHQHATFHHRAGIGPWNLVRQGVHHCQSERESCWTCTPCCINISNTKPGRVWFKKHGPKYPPVFARAPPVSSKRIPTERRGAVPSLILSDCVLCLADPQLRLLIGCLNLIYVNLPAWTFCPVRSLSRLSLSAFNLMSDSS